jgi:alkylation response protein AidB-like acyl-CoA dehydrogenase
VVRASGGVAFYTNPYFFTGSYLPAGGSSWNAISDRATKENFTPVDGPAVLEKLAAMPVQEYNLKSQDPSIRHIGPVAQDFNAAFGYGESDRAINMEDADGVALAAIQGLYQVVQEKDTQIATLQAENAAQQQQIVAMETRLAALEQAIERGSKGAEEQRRTLTVSSSPVLPVSLLGGLAVAAVLVGRRRLAGGGR